MKLTIFYDKKDINFLLYLTPISEEIFIEHKGCEMESHWEIGNDDIFESKLTCTENILIYLTKNSINSSWLNYILGYSKGRNMNCHIFTNLNQLPNWCRHFEVSKEIEELNQYYRNYNEIWFKEASRNIARKTIESQDFDITLTAFVDAVKLGDCLLAGIYLDAGFHATDKDRNGVPLICWAARKRKLPMIKLLMTAGADINAVSDDRHDTALIDAVSEDDLEIVIYVLKFNPDLEIQSKNGQTALIIASGHNNIDIIKILLKNGADFHKKDKLGMSAISYANLQQNEEAILLFSHSV